MQSTVSRYSSPNGLQLWNHVSNSLNPVHVLLVVSLENPNTFPIVVA